MSEGHRFEVDSKGEAYDVGIRDLRNKLHPLLKEARAFIDRNPSLNGHESDLILTMLTMRYEEEELAKLVEELEAISSTSSYVEEDGSGSQAFMEGEINWLALVKAALKSQREIRGFTQELSEEKHS